MTSAIVDPKCTDEDFSKVGRVLTPFRPSWTVTGAIGQLKTDMRRHGLSTDDLERTFVRLQRIQDLQAGGVLDEQRRAPGA